jgi:DNA-binding HxlR family transcriptional regulator
VPAKEPRRRSDCPISYALDIFGDRWSLLIVRDMLFKRRRRFGQFAEAEEGIATNILADRLARLEAEGLVSKAPDPENGRQFVYSLTPKGLDLAPVLVEMILWSAKYDAGSAADRSFVRKARTARVALVRELKLKATQ